MEEQEAKIRWPPTTYFISAHHVAASRERSAVQHWDDFLSSVYQRSHQKMLVCYAQLILEGKEDTGTRIFTVKIKLLFCKVCVDGCWEGWAGKNKVERGRRGELSWWLESGDVRYRARQACRDDREAEDLVHRINQRFMSGPQIHRYFSKRSSLYTN